MARAKQAKSQLQEYVEAILWAVALTFVLRAFVIQAFRIPSESMVKTLLVGDFLFVNKFEYGPKIPFTHVRLPGIRKPKLGDVIVFQYPPDPSKDYIKRCIATEGQTVEVREKAVHVNGRRLTEPYTQHIYADTMPAAAGPRDNMPPLTVPKGCLFMMGDNRDNSFDSRFWGPVEMDLVKGRAMFIYYSTGGNSWWNYLLNTRFDRMFRPIR